MYKYNIHKFSRNESKKQGMQKLHRTKNKQANLEKIHISRRKKTSNKKYSIHKFVLSVVCNLFIFVCKGLNAIISTF